MNTTGKTPRGVLEEISTRLAAILPEELFIPEMARRDDDHIVGTTTDHLKRLHTLRIQLVEQLRELMRHHEKAVHDVLTFRNMADPKRELENPDSPASKALAQMIFVQQEHSKVRMLHRIVDTIFWLEVRRQSSELDGKSCIGIRSDWSLCWNDAEELIEATLGNISVISINELNEMSASAHATKH